MKKIFPFYKGENISNNPLGYSSVSNAKKRMKQDDVVKDFDKTLPEDYWLGHMYIYELANPWNEDIRPNDVNKSIYENKRVNTHGAMFFITYYTLGYTKDGSLTNLKDLPDDVYELFVSLYKAEETSNKELYELTLYAILRKGFLPALFKDKKDYKKRFNKFVSDNVEFREIEVNVVYS